MQPTEQLSCILPTLSSMVDRIRPEQLDNPTPCDRFTVHDVLDHMIVLGGSFSYWFRGEEAPPIVAPTARDVVPAAEFRKTMDDLLDGARSPGAMERFICSPVGDMFGADFARFVAFDGLVHGWDLSRGTGLDYHLPADVIEAVDEFARTALTDDMRDGDRFKVATPVPDGAGRLEGLVAFSGRSV
jgi:uncharacterized protein (TIGR03086 family)